MQHVAERGTVAEEAQAEAGIAEPARIHRVLERSTPGAADIVENGSTHSEKPERIPVRIDAFFDSEQRAVFTALVAQWVAAQAVVAPQKQQIGCLRIPHNIAGCGCIKQTPLALRYVVAQ